MSKHPTFEIIVELLSRMATFTSGEFHMDFASFIAEMKEVFADDADKEVFGKYADCAGIDRMSTSHRLAHFFGNFGYAKYFGHRQEATSLCSRITDTVDKYNETYPNDPNVDYAKLVEKVISTLAAYKTTDINYNTSMAYLFLNSPEISGFFGHPSQYACYHSIVKKMLGRFVKAATLERKHEIAELLIFAICNPPVYHEIPQGFHSDIHTEVMVMISEDFKIAFDIRGVEYNYINSLLHLMVTSRDKSAGRSREIERIFLERMLELTNTVLHEPDCNADVLSLYFSS